MASRSAGVAMYRSRMRSRKPGASCSIRRSISSAKRSLRACQPSGSVEGTREYAQRVCAAGRRPRWIAQRLLPDHEVGVRRQPTSSDLPREASKIGDAVAGMHDRRFASFRRTPGHPTRKRPIHLEGAPAIAKTAHAPPHPADSRRVVEQSTVQRRWTDVGQNRTSHGDLVSRRSANSHGAVRARRCEPRAGR